ncbi:MAG: hypothetical protein MUE97_03580 [Phycisphaerales bacterium]|jgi:hypothetical protein|nr:hypothetical protein [Phycisphaerales bacterium]
MSAAMSDFEKLGQFYLGREVSPGAGKSGPDSPLMMYDSKDLVTHGVCVGMTGSGKTGLCLAILEEAAIDGIPALIIDPKGDLANLLLTFPNLQAQDFRPWINESDAQKAGQTPDAFAAGQAALWSKGLASWRQDGSRIKRLADACERVIYTPGSSAGVQLSILKGFDCPPPAILNDAELFRERVSVTAASLLNLASVKADPLTSREHILLCNILYIAWSSGQSLDLPGLIAQIQKPPFTRVGVLELEAFFPAKDRFALAMSLNNLLASPQLSAWAQGEPLDIQSMLYTPAGKPKLAIVSIAHLTDSERMFFVTLLLSNLLAWTRSQSGTSSLRAICYMDEIAGYCPPNGMPPSKQPLLTLMKQARAFGVGVLLATQNPVDIDYKGLSNAGTWLIGRLQTDQDKARVLDGLEGASAAASAAFDRATMDRLISGLGRRVFLMNNVHESAPVVFETRWCLSYLRGPLTRDQIRALTHSAGASANANPFGAAIGPASGADQRVAMAFVPPGMGGSDAVAGAASRAATAPTAATALGPGTRPMLPPAIPQRFLPVRTSQPAGATLHYTPAVLGFTKTFFADAKLGIDVENAVALLAPVQTGGLVAVDWEAAEQVEIREEDLAAQPAGSATFGDLPPEASVAKSFDAWRKQCADAVFRAGHLELLRFTPMKLVSKPGEDEAAFRARLSQVVREQRDAGLEKLRTKYAPKIATLQERLRKAEQKVETQKGQKSQAQMGSALSIGGAVLGALLGRKVMTAGNLSKAATAVGRVGRAGQEAGDVARAEEDVQAVQAQIAALQEQFKAEVDATIPPDPTTVELETLTIKPKKTGITVRAVTLAWLPEWDRGPGMREPAWR